MSSICFYVSHIEGLCNSESLVNRIFDDSSWQGSKSAKQRLYVIGGESPNKKWMHKAVFLGCLPFTWANRTGWRCSCLIFYQLFPHYFCKKWIGATNENSDVDLREMESKTRYRKISLRNRVYHLHKFISFTDNCRENKTKFFFFTITERILARWLVKSDGLWEYSPLKWRNVSRSAGRFVFGFS